jgi:hypothetical protein
MSQVLCNFLSIPKSQFVSDNFVEYLPDFGGYFSKISDANKILRVRDWLKIYIPVDENIFESEGPSFNQEILFPLPIKSFENKKRLKSIYNFAT